MSVCMYVNGSDPIVLRRQYRLRKVVGLWDVA